MYVHLGALAAVRASLRSASKAASDCRGPIDRVQAAKREAALSARVDQTPRSGHDVAEGALPTLMTVRLEMALVAEGRYLTQVRG